MKNKQALRNRITEMAATLFRNGESLFDDEDSPSYTVTPINYGSFEIEVEGHVFAVHVRSIRKLPRSMRRQLPEE